MSGTVILTFPSDTANVSLARTVTASMAARADLPLDLLEDARLAVDEAVTQLIGDAEPGSDIRCAFRVEDGSLEVTVSADSRTGRALAHGTFSWTVLTALATVVESEHDDGRVSLQLTIARPLAVDA